MSLQGPPLGDNRFALLSTSPKAKRKKALAITKEIFPSLPYIKKDNPKYLVASSINTNKPLNKYSCFAVHKALKNISTENIEISSLRDGSLLLFVKNDSVAKKFIATTKLIGVCDVKIEMHQNLNHSKGTIYAPCLNDIPEKEIVENLSDQGVVSAYKFTKRSDGQSFASGVVLLTFDLYQLPEKLEVSWYTTKVRPYFPNPMRCKSCQMLGHTTKRCNKTPVCDSCALPPHMPTSCPRTFCANCSGNHAASSKSCPKFVQMKQIIIIKTEKKCSMREAIRLHKMQIPPTLNESSPSFSNITKNTNIKTQNNNITLDITNQQTEQISANPSNLHIVKTNSTTNGSKQNTTNTTFKPVSAIPTVDTNLPSTSNNNNNNPQSKQILSNSNNAKTPNNNRNEYNVNTDGTVDYAQNNSHDYCTTNPATFSSLSQLITENTPQKEQ